MDREQGLTIQCPNFKTHLTSAHAFMSLGTGEIDIKTCEAMRYREFKNCENCKQECGNENNL